MKISSPLMDEIDRQGLRREFFAAAMGVKPWTLSKIEAGKQPVPAGFYERAAAYLRVPVDSVRPVPATEAKAA
jgi:transcriptional regulator with XRE-family HTH domain